MPRYVFEQSATLPAGDTLSATQGRAIAATLATFLGVLLRRIDHPRVEVGYGEPVEHVTGDWLPPDEQGHIKLGASRPIDL